MKSLHALVSLIMIMSFSSLSLLPTPSLAQEGIKRPRDAQPFFPTCSESESKRFRGLFEKDEDLPPINDPFDMMMVMEETKNVPLFRQGTAVETAQMGAYPRSQVTVNLVKGFPKDIKDKFIRKVKGKLKVFFPVHPLNTNPTVAGFDIIMDKNADPADKSSILIRNLASRSKMVVEPGIPAFGLKIATNQIVPGVIQEGKVDIDLETVYTRARTSHIDETDKLIGKDPAFTMLREIGSFRRKDKEGGFIIREMDPLRNGDIYIPAISIPYVGRQVAAENGETFKAFWGKHYAYELGQAKAKLLLRYGLQMLTPNSQNVLVQLDRNLRPKGIVLRDNADAHFVKNVITALSPSDKWYKFELRMGNFIKDYLYAHNSNSTWRFDEAPGDQTVVPSTIEDWNRKQARGYMDHINSELGLSLIPLAYPTHPAITEYMKRITDSHHDNDVGKREELQYIVPISDYLSSPAGQKRLLEYRREQISREQERKAQEEEALELECLNPTSIVEGHGRRKRKTITESEVVQGSSRSTPASKRRNPNPPGATSTQQTATF